MNKNIFGDKLIVCSKDPLTGYFRNGCCDTDDTDVGMHAMSCCAVVCGDMLYLVLWHAICMPCRGVR